ncbi:MAG: riboflavin kinase/FMN adenylyltransferase [Oleiphilaceae bacterium]|jgi:riboflavin kinase/FMN adenylyltransferase
MHLLRGLHNPGLGYSGVSNTKCVATIGNFDGVHLGHQAIIQQVISEAKKRQLPALIIVLEPQPMEFFKVDDAPARLMRFREKFQVLSAYDLDYIFCLKFDEKLSQLSAKEFVQNVLVSHLNVDHLVIGDDFRFGGDRQGDYKLLCRLSKEFSFTVENTETILAKESCDSDLGECSLEESDFLQRASSTFIRELLSIGELTKVEQLLGRPYSFCGRVVHGQKLGRQLGFPTANINLKRVSSPLSGVYAVSLFLKSEIKMIPGVANVGCKPTVGQFKPSLEVHLFDFNREIYGEYVEVQFHYKLRDEQKFSGIEQLKAQIEIDSQAARAFFASELS